MIHIETRGFALFISPFGWIDIAQDVKHGPAFRARFGKVLFGNWHHG